MGRRLGLATRTQISVCHEVMVSDMSLHWGKDALLVE